MPRVLRASGLRRSGVQGGVQTTFTVAGAYAGHLFNAGFDLLSDLNVRRDSLEPSVSFPR